MPTIETMIEIAAPPTAVWQVLTDFSGDRSWDPFFVGIDGELRPGAQLTVTVAPPGGRPMTFSPRVLVADSPRELCWLGRLLVPGVFDGRHQFLLDPAPGGGTSLVHREEFGGVLTLFGRGMFDRTRAGFAVFNSALKERAEMGP